MKTLVFDVETNGLLKQLDRIHVLVIGELETRQIHIFRRNTVMDNIAEGIALLESGDLIIGHNSIAFDKRAIEKVFPDAKLLARHMDTMVLSRVAVPDLKKKDFELWRKGMPGELVGTHSLEAWGWRVGKHKGDYMKMMQAKGIDPWAEWNQDMEDYCVNDVEITTIVWESHVVPYNIPETCLTLEHDIHTLTTKMQENGFPFKKAEAEALAESLKSTQDRLVVAAKETFGERYFTAARKIHVKPLFLDPAGLQKKKFQNGGFAKPNETLGEDLTRPWWGEITFPKRTQVRNGKQYSVDAPFCKGAWKEFNPTSRPQLTEKFIIDFEWEPDEFTETGAPSLDADTLEKLAIRHPICKVIADLFSHQKLLGYIVEGPQSWLKNYNEETGKIHGYINTGGTVTGRCSHSKPNMGQVPAVSMGKDKKPILGFAGDYGWECRSLFHVPEHWLQVGVDLSGIEFRALANLTSEFDGGELIDVVLNGDIHQYNMDKTGIPSRDIVKRVLYGLLYGAGDEKLGMTVKPIASKSEHISLGREIRGMLMAGLPALKKAIDTIQEQASRGFILGLDGRRLMCRSQHSALNTRLQSDGALIAKRWLCLTEWAAIDAGAHHGWENGEFLGDFAMMAFNHDEQQTACAPDFAEMFAQIAKDAAVQAGKDLGFKCPVAAESKIGGNWAECH